MIKVQEDSSKNQLQFILPDVDHQQANKACKEEHQKEEDNLIGMFNLSEHSKINISNQVKEEVMEEKKKSKVDQVKRKAKMPMSIVKKIVIIDFGYFKEPGNRHFPEKKLNCVKCKVCRWQFANNLTKQIRKTKYRCMGCFIKYERNVNLCITPCFEEFHLQPDKYLRRNISKKSKKIDQKNSSSKNIQTIQQQIQ